jgi:hypothetical protein
MSTRFKDTQGHEWDCKLVTSTILRVRDGAGVDLLNIEKYAEAFADPIKVIDVIWCIVKPQAAALGLSYEQFIDRIDGDTVHHAGEAIEQGLLDFFRDSPRGQLLTKLRAAGAKAREKAMSEIDAKLAAAITAALPSGPSGNVPASSESIPENSRSGS